jgi:hypothetical protein
MICRIPACQNGFGESSADPTNAQLSVIDVLVSVALLEGC